MPELTGKRAQLLCGVAAGIIYVGVIGHEWAFDDGTIIETNPAAHSISGAVDAFFSPYWPGDETTSGQYRPLVILSYAVDWVVSGGSPAWFHVMNVVLHAATTVVFVAVALMWLNPVGATVAGLIFAIHPLHVEAVANVVGRAEVLVAFGVFASVLAARKYRRAPDLRRRALWLGVTSLSLLASLLVKEHAVIVAAVVMLDELLDPRGHIQRSIPLYIGIVAITFGWFYLWLHVAGQFVSVSEAATVRGLSGWQRLATMFPAQLEVVRLLVLPVDLAADYNPQIIPRRTEWSWFATIGLMTSGAIVGVAIAAWKKAPVISFGILFAVISYSPTSNLLFSSGIILAERNLYLAVVATALVLGWLTTHSLARAPQFSRYTTHAVLAGVTMLLLVYGGRTITRIPFWRDSDTVLLMDFAEHSENYRARLRLGGFYRANGNLPAALTEAITAGAIFPEDPWVSRYTVVRALDLGLPHVALAQAQRAYDLEPEHPSFARLIVRARIAQGELDSAAAVARRSIVDAPQSPLAMWSYTEVLDSLRAPPWQLHFARARFDYLEDRLILASARVDSGYAVLGDIRESPNACWEVTQTVPALRALNEEAATTVERMLERATPQCRAFSPEGTAPS